MTYSTLNAVKDELTLNYSNTNYDTELNNLLALVDGEINAILQKYTSLPVQTEIANQLAYPEATMVALHFRIKRATPQEQQQLQAILKNNQDRLKAMISANFKRAFFVTSSSFDNDDMKWAEDDA